MTDTANLRISVTQSGVSQADAGLQRLTRNGRQAEQQVDRLRGSFGSIRGVIATLGLGVAANELSNYADEWTNLTNRLRLATDSNTELARAQQDVFEISQNTRAGVAATSELYFRLSQNAGELITTQQELADITTTINQAIAVSGATAQESAGALRQLSQGLAAGALRGEEFNSVIEQTPRLATAISDSLGIQRGELRALANDGELTSQVVIEALRSQAEVINQEYATSIATIDQAWTNLDNVLLQAVGTIDETTNASAIARDIILSVSSSINSLAGDTESLNSVLDGTQTVLTLTAGIIGGRYLGSLTEAVLAKGALVAASERTIATNARETATTLAQVQAEVALLRVQQQSLANTIARVQSENIRNTLRIRLTATTTALAAAEARLATATTAAGTAAAGAAVSTRLLTTATAGLSGAMALLGGPVGVAIIAAVALTEFTTSSIEAERRALELSTDVDTLAESFRGLSFEGRALRINAFNSELESVRSQMRELRIEIEATQAASVGATQSDFGVARVAALQSQYRELEQQLSQISAQQQAVFQAGMPEITRTLSEPEVEQAVRIDDSLVNAIERNTERIVGSLGTRQERALNTVQSQIVQLDEARNAQIISERDFQTLSDALWTQYYEGIEERAQQSADRQTEIEARRINQLTEASNSVILASQTEQQRQIGNVQDQIIILRDARDEQLISDREFVNVSEQLWSNYYDSIEQRAQQSAQNRTSIEDAIITNNLSAVQTATQSLTQFVDQGNAFGQAIFIANQALAAGIVFNQGQIASIAALAPPPLGLGPVAGVGLATSIEAQTIARIGAIGAQTVAGLSRAQGGDFAAGDSITVGERGRERVTFDQPGVISPNSSSQSNSSAANVTIQQNITVQGNGDAALINAMREAAEEGGRRGYQSVLTDMRSNGNIRRASRV